jgi:hypothetical protein
MMYKNSRKMRPGVVTGLVILVMMAVLSGASMAVADGPAKVGLVVVHDGEVIEKCVSLDGESGSGYDVLKKSGLDLNMDASNSMGAAICRIDGEGCNYPEQGCFCQCQSAPCVYWSYWQRDGDEWRYSNLGATNTTVRHGDVEGWVWGEGVIGSSGSEPPTADFDALCNPPTDTPTPVPTDTPTPTNTPEPEDTATPTPQPTPVIHGFGAARSEIKAGESVTLQWNLDGAQAAYLRYDGKEEAVVAPGSKTVAPAQHTTYQLVAVNGDGGEAVAEVIITVNEVAAASSSASIPAPAATATPVPQPQQASQTAPPPEASQPEPMIGFGAASTTLPQGACTTLTWQVTNAESVAFDDESVNVQGSREVCPAESRGYVLRVSSAAGEREARVDLTVTEPVGLVDDAGPEATATPTLAPMMSPAAGATSAALVIGNDDPSGGNDAVQQEARRFRVTEGEVAEQGTSSWLVAGGVTLAILLLVVIPVAVLVIGGIAFYMKKQRL